MNFLKISHFTLFGIHAKDTNFTFGTPYTHMYTDTHRDAHIQTQMQIPFSHFVLFGSFGIHTTDLHMHRHSDRVSTETLTHRYRYTDKITHNPVLIKYVFIYKIEPTGCLCIQTRNS